MIYISALVTYAIFNTLQYIPLDVIYEFKIFYLFRFVLFRFMPNVSEATTYTDNKKYIESAFGVLCNKPLMNNHSASWEIFVSKRHIIEYNTEGNLSAHIPVTKQIQFPFLYGNCNHNE